MLESDAISMASNHSLIDLVVLWVCIAMLQSILTSTDRQRNTLEVPMVHLGSLNVVKVLTSGTKGQGKY